MSRWALALFLVIVACMATACSVNPSAEKVTGKVQLTVLEDGSVGSAELVFVSDPTKRDQLEAAVARMRRWKIKPSGTKATRIVPIRYVEDGPRRRQLLART